MHGGTSRSVDRDLAQEVEVIQHLPRAQDDRGLRVVRHRDGEAGLLAEALVEVLELRAAAGQDDSLVHDVRGQLRGGLLQSDAHGLNDVGDRFRERLADLLIGNHQGLGYALHKVAPFDLHRQLLVERERRADVDLDLLRGALADQQVVLALDVLDDVLVHAVARDAHRSRVDDPGHRDHRDVRRPPADVHDHVARRLSDWKTRPDRRGHRLLDEVDLGSLRPVRAVLDRALLDLGDIGGNADDDARPYAQGAVVRLLDEVIEHLLRVLEVGDDAVLHRPDGADVRRCAAQHLLRPLADRLDASRSLIDGDDRGLAQDDPLALRVDQRGGGSEVDGKIVREETEHRPWTPSHRRPHLRLLRIEFRPAQSRGFAQNVAPQYLTG